MPENDAGRPSTSFMPATPEIVIGLELKTVCPRAMLARDVDREFVQVLNKLNILGLKGVPVGLNPKLAGKESLIPIKNACRPSATGPPVARPSFKKPAR